MPDNPEALPCPRCGAAMRIVLVVPAVAGHPELTSYACRVCGDVTTKAEGDDGPS
jgi:rubredoxin